MKMKQLICALFGVALSSSLFAGDVKPIACNKFKAFANIKSQIATLDEKFSWDDAGCKIVATKSIFPKQDKKGTAHFEKGLQLFVYQDNELKFICLPGWECKSW